MKLEYGRRLTGHTAWRRRQSTRPGMLGPLGPTLSVTILATPPSTPSTPTLFAGDVTGPSGGNLTSVRQPRIMGSARAGIAVEALNASTGAILASATASARRVVHREGQ